MCDQSKVSKFSTRLMLDNLLRILPYAVFSIT